MVELDWSRITGFEWDTANARKSLDKHSVTAREAEEPFLNGSVIAVPDPRHSLEEARFHALGVTDDDRGLQITFTLRSHSTLIRVISARPMSRKERLAYAKTIE